MKLTQNYDFTYLSINMRYRGLITILILFAFRLSAQESRLDTIVLPDTIRGKPGSLKSSFEFTYESRVDSVNTLVINEFMAVNFGDYFDQAGDDDDWIELFNFGDSPVRLTDLFFTDDPAEPYKWKLDTMVDLELDPDEYFIIWADDEPDEGYNHATFRLSGDGEYLGIFSEDGTPVDQLYYGTQTANISFGRYPDAGLSWNYFDEASPGETNAFPGAWIVLPLPSSNLTGGFYTEPLMLELFAEVNGAQIYYTTDCSEPDRSATLYQVPLEIRTTTIIRARLIREDALDGPVLTISLLMDDTDYENPVISLVAEPDALFGSTGIISSNNSTIEVPAALEYIENGISLFRGGAGIQLHAPRHAQPYSLDIYARSRYDKSWLEYPFFGDRAPDEFKRLILRNSGNDNVNKASTNTHFRDPLIQTLGKQSNRHPMISESKPVNLFLNGSYHGLFNLREREDRYYIESHTGETENFDFIELEFGYYANLHIIEGSYLPWMELLSFADTTGDLSLDADFSIVEQAVDLENFTDYWITEVFVGNYDWLSNNVKFWKPEHGKWQWMYWDTDHGLGLDYSQYGAVEWNTLAWSLTFSDRAWSNGYHNILIRNLLKNTAYKEHFIKRFTQLLSTSFKYETTLPALDSMKSLYRNDMNFHAERWGRSMTNWENACTIVEDYLRRRPDTVLTHIRDFFGLQEPVQLSIRVEPPGAGKVSFSGLEISKDPVQGKFFPGMDYELISSPIPGFSLDQWKPFQSREDSLEFQLSDSMEIIAYFLASDLSFPIQLCEVYSNNREAYDAGDWVEFYYYGADPVDLEGWYLMADDLELLYTFHEPTIIAPGQRFIIAEDPERFAGVFPRPIQCFGPMNQGFSNRATLSLKSGEGETRKRVALMASPDWPVLPEQGFSIELKGIVYDSDLGSHWDLSENSFGSPGLANHEFYDFQKPSGKDSVFTNYETHVIGFSSSRDFFSDRDQHALAGVAVKEITGAGLFYREESSLAPGTLYEPFDLVFQPQGPQGSSSSLTYSFIDKSGQESSDYTLWFNPSVQVPQKPQETFRIYPLPARDFCTIEIPAEHQGQIDFLLFDLNGKKLQAVSRHMTQKILTIDLSTVESGIYIYLLKTSRTVIHGKIEVLK